MKFAVGWLPATDHSLSAAVEGTASHQRWIARGPLDLRISLRVNVVPDNCQDTSLVMCGSTSCPALPPTRAHLRQTTRKDLPSTPGEISSAPSAAVMTRPSASSRKGTIEG